MIGALVIVLSVCSSESEPTAVPTAVSTVPTVAPTASTAGSAGDSLPVIPDNSEVDRKTAMLLGIDLHRQLWSSRPTDNYKYGFQWNVGDYAYQRANVEVRIIPGKLGKTVNVAIGHSIFERTCKVSVGDLCAEYGGGGHFGAGTCQLEPETAQEKIDEIIARLKEPE